MAAKAANMDEVEGGGKARSKLPGKKALIGIAVLLAIAAGGYVFMKRGAAPSDAQQLALKKKSAFFDLPEMTVNLAGQPGQERPVYLKLRVSLEVEDAKMIPEIQPLLPRVIDNFQIFLRELRPADLEGSAGLYRLKEEMTRRINAAVYPSRVEAILFRDVLVQ